MHAVQGCQPTAPRFAQCAAVEMKRIPVLKEQTCLQFSLRVSLIRAKQANILRLDLRAHDSDRTSGWYG
jgi:hypothetical protein